MGLQQFSTYYYNTHLQDLPGDRKEAKEGSTAYRKLKGAVVAHLAASGMGAVTTKFGKPWSI